VDSDFVTTVLALKIGWTEIAQSRMAAAQVVPNLNVIEQTGTSFLTGDIASVHTLGFEGGEEAFHDRIVITVAGPAHADLNTMFSQQQLVIVAGILAAAIRMVQQSS
jgi:hypothetical protein